jgi:hypothetical protein
MMPNPSAAANRHPRRPFDVDMNLQPQLSAHRPPPVAVAELGR